MKKVFLYLRTFYAENFNWKSWLVGLLFVVGFCYLNYYTPLIKQTRIDVAWKPTQFFFYFGLYFTPILLGFLIQSLFDKKWELWRNKLFWFLILFATALFSIRSSSHFFIQDFRLVLYKNIAQPEVWYSVFSTIVRGAILFLPIIFYWYINDKKHQPLYGFTRKNFDLKPYFAMLAIMVPLIALASTQGDFLSSYPRGQRFSLDVHNAQEWPYIALYEVFYGLDFFSIEFFFRGFMILAFVKIAGTRAILPMAMFYVVIHFGKPMGETISSFFGGTLLGIIAFYSRSILGGIIVHVGIAYLMEIGAIIGNYLKN